MKIAIVAPSPVPFVIGGAENLWTGLLSALNALPGVQADLIKLPSPERNAAEILHSYEQFSRLDLSHFDQVITTKYPAWMLQHPNHVVYVQHKLRGLYDTYPAHLATDWQQDCPLPKAVQDMLRLPSPERALLPDLFGQLREWLQQHPDHPAMQLPGPLLRAIVHQLDRIALAPGNIARYLAISDTVRQRDDHFPPGADVTVLYHPTSLQTQGPLPAEAIFTASRLDYAKRIDLLIQAYLQAGITTPLRIAGSGPAEGELKALAKPNPNIQFLGRISEAQLVDEYRKALFVPFVPYQEDYGLITLEAMQSGKPVVSVHDAGGVNELVRHGQTGRVVAPDAASLAAVFREYAANPDMARREGEAAMASVQAIQWDATARALLHKPWRRCKVVVANTFPIYPAQSGGQLRMYHLYRQLSQYADVTVVNLCHDLDAPLTRELAPHFTEVLIPRSQPMLECEQYLEADLGVSAGDLSVAVFPQLVPDFVAALAKAAQGADIAIASHCYGYAALKQVATCPVWYDAHNVEYALKADMYPAGSPWLAAIHELEKACVLEAEHIFVCSEDDARHFGELYGLAPAHMHLAANGVDIAGTPYTSQAERYRLQQQLGITRPLLLFMGSLHQPNIDAALQLVAMAEQRPEWDFLLMGTVCHSPLLESAPANIVKLGLVSDTEKQYWLRCVDIGLNPMVSGSGTNLKILEYAACGVPIVSTGFGLRGGVLQAGEHAWVGDDAGLLAAAETLLALTPEQREHYVLAARKQVASTVDWSVAAACMAAYLPQ